MTTSSRNQIPICNGALVCLHNTRTGYPCLYLHLSLRHSIIRILVYPAMVSYWVFRSRHPGKKKTLRFKVSIFAHISCKEPNQHLEEARMPPTLLILSLTISTHIRKPSCALVCKQWTPNTTYSPVLAYLKKKNKTKKCHQILQLKDSFFVSGCQRWFGKMMQSSSLVIIRIFLPGSTTLLSSLILLILEDSRSALCSEM